MDDSSFVAGKILPHNSEDTVMVCAHAHHFLIKKDDVCEGVISSDASPDKMWPCNCEPVKEKRVIVPRTLLQKFANEL